MASRFSTRRTAPEFPPVEPASAPTALPSADEVVAWTVFPEAEPEADPSAPLMLAPEPEPAASPASAPAASNPLLTDKLLDAKVRLHRKLIEEINLSALEKLPEEEIRKHVQQLVSQYSLV